jgi:hypothetical protein
MEKNIDVRHDARTRGLCAAHFEDPTFRGPRSPRGFDVEEVNSQISSDIHHANLAHPHQFFSGTPKTAGILIHNERQRAAVGRFEPFLDSEDGR